MGQRPTSAGTTYYLNDGGSPVLELNSSGTATALNLFGADGIVARETNPSGSGTWSEYVFDLLGNTALRTSSTGAVQGAFEYDAYGGYSAETGSADPWMYQAQSGYYYDAATQATLCGHRYYDWSQCRWLNRDPAAYAGGTDLYGYCGGNPIGRSDASGLQECALGIYPIYGLAPGWSREDCMQAANDGAGIAVGGLAVLAGALLAPEAVPGALTWSSETTCIAVGGAGTIAAGEAGAAYYENTLATDVAGSDAVLAAGVANLNGGRQGSAVVAVLNAEGEQFVGVSSSSPFVRAALHPEVQNFFETLDPSLVNEFTGQCAEPDAISQALRLGIDPRGGAMGAARIQSGMPKAPCDACRALMEEFGIAYYLPE